MTQPIDKNIDQILQKTLKETSLNIQNINANLVDIVLDSSYSPVFTGTLWKLYKYLNETSKYSNNFIWIPSGNSIGFLKYNGHIPWDDDIDIGFQINDNFDTYITFLIECINKGFIVNLHITKVDDDTINWYDNDKTVNLILDSRSDPNWSFIKVNDFRNMLKEHPSRFHFASVTLQEIYWKKICNRFDFNPYMWNGQSVVTPWIDIIPFIKNDDMFISHINDLKKSTPPISTSLEYYNFLTVPIKFPKDLLPAILQQYNAKRSYINFIHWDTIYSHVKKNKIILDYNIEPELHKFIRAYANKYNDSLLYFMNQISYNELSK